MLLNSSKRIHTHTRNRFHFGRLRCILYFNPVKWLRWTRLSSLLGKGGGGAYQTEVQTKTRRFVILTNERCASIQLQILFETSSIQYDLKLYHCLIVQYCYNYAKYIMFIHGQMMQVLIVCYNTSWDHKRCQKQCYSVHSSTSNIGSLFTISWSLKQAEWGHDRCSIWNIVIKF